MILKNLILVVIVFVSLPLAGQDIEQVLKAPLIATNGGISVNQIATWPPRQENGQPYSLYLSGNLNTNIKGAVSLPISFAYTNNKANANLPQPFNRFSMSPSYKWITAHMGYTSMNFSPYTLAGHELLGAGIELSPEELPIRFSMVYGRFQKAVEADTAGATPAYRRMGGGFKIEYSHEMLNIALDFFKAKDDINSIPSPQNVVQDSITAATAKTVKPQENATGSIKLGVQPIKSLRFNVEYAISAVNHDIGQQDSTGNGTSGFLIQNEGDLAYYHAFKSSVSQQTKIGNIGATYERVAPNYKTLGAYYFNNDLENITANLSTSLYKVVHIAMDYGYQRDNILDQKVNGSFNTLFNFNTSAQVGKRANLGAAFSNNQTHVYVKSIYDELSQTNEFQNLDSLNFTQLNLTASANAGFVVKATKSQMQNASVSFTYQEATEQQAEDQRFKGSRIYNTTASYLFSLTEHQLNISTTVNNNFNKMQETDMSVMSYNLSVRKSFHDKIKASCAATYSTSTNSGEKVADITNVRLTGGYTLAKQHNFNLSLAFVNNKTTQGTDTQYSVSLSYNYMFNFRVNRNEKKLQYEGDF